jgi:hypothetical protein
MQNKMQNKFTPGNSLDIILSAVSNYFAAIGITYAFFIQPDGDSLLFSHTALFMTVLILSSILRAIWSGVWPKKHVDSSEK